MTSTEAAAIPNRYTVVASDSAVYPYAVHDGRHKTEVTAFRFYADAVDVALDMNLQYAADLEESW